MTTCRLIWLTLIVSIVTTAACKASEPAIWDSPYTKAEALAWGEMCGPLHEPSEFARTEDARTRPSETNRIWISKGDKRIVQCRIKWQEGRGVVSMSIEVAAPWILGAEHESITPQQMRPYVDLLTAKLTKRARDEVWQSIFTDPAGTNFNDSSDFRKYGKLVVDSGRFSSESEGWQVSLAFRQ
ncbi:MAG: hypothetical protein R3B06_24525 [Kofleriaceae bacterium]